MRFDPTGMTPEQIAEMNRLNDQLYGGPDRLPTPAPPPGPVPAGFGNEGFGNQPIGSDLLSPITQSLPAPGYGETVMQGPSSLSVRGMPFPPRPILPPYYGPPLPPPRPQPMGIGSLFRQLAYMPEDQFSRNLGRFQQFTEQYGGWMSPNMNRRGRLGLFNQLGGLTDDQFTMGMDRLSQYRNVFDPQPQTGTPQGQAMPPPQTADQMQSALNQDRLARQYYESPANPYYSPSYTGSFGQPRNPYFGGDFGGGIAGRGLYGGMGGGMGMGYGAFGGGGYYQPSAPPSNSVSIGGKGGAEPAGGGGKGGGV